MRTLLAACVLIAASLAHAGVLVELTDGTTLTVESHWNDGNQVHLVRGGVDMIVAKSRIKSINEDVEDPEVYRGGGVEAAEAKAGGDEADAPEADEPPTAPQAEVQPALSDLSAEELEAVQGDENARLLEAQEKRFNAGYGGGSPQQQKEADEAFARQSRRAAEVGTALHRAKAAAEGGVPTVPAVEQPQ